MFAGLTWDVVKGPLLKALPWLALAGILIAAYLWIHGMQSTIADQKTQIGTLQTNLQAETLARTKDVAGLTTLAQGTAAAAVKTKSDTAILGTVIDAKDPAPSSPGLAALMQCLRDADTSGRQCSPTAGTGAAAAH